MLLEEFLLGIIHVESGILETVQQRNGIGAVHVSGSGTSGYEGVGCAAIDSDILNVLERQHALVLEKDHSFECAFAGDLGMGCEVGLVGYLVSLHLGTPQHKLQAAPYADVKFGLGEGAVLDGCHDLLELKVGAWLKHIVASGNLCGAVVTSVPVGHHETLETPVAAEDVGDEFA